MATQEITKIGKRGTMVIPAALRRRFALEEGSHVIIEECEDGVSVRPAVAMPVEIYSRKESGVLLEQRRHQGRLPLGGERSSPDGA